MSNKEKTMEYKEQVVIEFDGMRYVFEDLANGSCNACLCNIQGEPCKLYSANICTESSIIGRICTSATKIDDEAKVYGPHNSKMAKHLVGNYVETWHPGNDCISSFWEKTILGHNIDIGSQMPFLSNKRGTWHSIIRELKTETITLTEARERFNIPANVVIEGE